MSQEAHDSEERMGLRLVHASACGCFVVYSGPCIAVSARLRRCQVGPAEPVFGRRILAAVELAVCVCLGWLGRACG